MLRFSVNKILHGLLGLVVAIFVLVLVVLPEVHGLTPSFNGAELQFLTSLFYFINLVNFKACVLLYVAVNLLQSVEPEAFLLLKLLHLLSKTVRLDLALFLVVHLFNLSLTVERVYLQKRYDKPHFVAAALLVVFVP